MTPEQRDLFALIRRAIRDVGAVYIRMAAEVARVLEPYAQMDRWSMRDRIDILRDLDRVFGRVFGTTRQAALTSDLFLTMLRGTDAAAERPFVRMIDRVQQTVTRRDPSLWQRMRLRLLAGGAQQPDGFGRVMVAFAYWDEDLQRRIVPRSVEQQRIIRAGKLDPNRAWVNGSRYRLSDRVWRTGRLTRRAIDDRLRLAIARGDAPIRVARELERYLNPEWQPVRTGPAGRIVVDTTRKQVYTMHPRGGHGSNPARRLVRTEMMHAHAAATAEAGKITPGAIGLKWVLSARHAKADECDKKAHGGSLDMGLGEYTFDEFPEMPSHPNCLCVSTVVMASRDTVIDDLVAQYGGL